MGKIGGTHAHRGLGLASFPPMVRPTLPRWIVRLPVQRRGGGRLTKVLKIEYIAQVAQAFAGESARLEVVRGDERVHVAICIEGAAISRYIEGGGYPAWFAVRTLITTGAFRGDIWPAGLVEEPAVRGDWFLQQLHSAPLGRCAQRTVLAREREFLS
jgi:hypothetical protein